MARSEARILVEIWDDDDFLALTPLAQRLFLFLISQRDLEHTGVIGLRERRWAKCAAGMSTGDVVAALRELEHARFVVVDEDAEEVLVRSFIRRDKVFKQPNVMRAAMDRVGEISSRRIREELLVELHRIVETESMSEAALAIVEEMREALAKACGNPSRNPSRNPSAMTPRDPTDEGSPKGCQLRLGEWGVGNGEESSEDQKLSQDADAADPDSTTSKAKPKSQDDKLPSTHPKLTWPDKQIDADPLFIGFWTAYPRKEDKGQARKTWLSVLRNKDVTPEKIVQGALDYRNDASRSSNFTKKPSTWLNAEGWANYDEPAVAEAAHDPEATWLN